jgi:hypothetical protein
MEYGPIYTKLRNHWHRRAEKRAWRNPRYREIDEALRTEDGFKHFDADMMLESSRIFRQINPQPWYLEFLRWWHQHGVRATSRELKFRHQRATRGYSDRDLWVHPGQFLAQFNADVLRAFREDLHSYPNGMSLEEWRQILQVMIDGFEAAALLCSTDLAMVSMEDLEREKNEGFALFSKHLVSLWD